MILSFKLIAKYSLLPGIIPRIKALTGSGFANLAYFLAQVYAIVGLLPRDHAYLVYSNIGRYGLRHVVGESVQNIQWKWAHIDQIIVFVLLMIGLIILFLQFLVLSISIFMHTAQAAGISDFFGSQNTTFDIAFMLMDGVFGIPDFFNSCIAQDVSCNLNAYSNLGAGSTGTGTTGTGAVAAVTGFPYPYHLAMQSMLRFYSVGLMVIAVMLFVYFITTILAETAQTGTPFGKRYNHVWAPVRMVAALGLLIPVTNGLNAGQYVTLYAAKWGSNFATNGWNEFLDTTSGTIANGDNRAVTFETNDGSVLQLGTSYVGVPNSPPVNTLMEFFTAVGVCKGAIELSYPGRVIDAYIVNPRNVSEPFTPFLDHDFETAFEYSDGADIEVVFGEPKQAEVEPTCGSLKIPVAIQNEDDNPGAWFLQDAYFIFMAQLWLFTEDIDLANASVCTSENPFSEFDFPYISDIALCIIEDKIMGGTSYRACVAANNPSNSAATPANCNDLKPKMPNAESMSALREAFEFYVETSVQSASEVQADSGKWTEGMKPYGWGGAAFFYNRIAELNGSLVTSAYNVPVPVEYPKIMEEVKEHRQKHNQSDSGVERYNPILEGAAKSKPLSLNARDKEIAIALYESQRIWESSTSDQEPTGNMFEDVLHLLFGTKGLFDMRSNIEAGIHPMAVLSSVGRSIIDSSIRNIAISVGAGFGGGLMEILGEKYAGMKSILGAVSSFSMTIGTIALSAGFVLFYVIPLMPFIYFFFAVAGWVKSILEAMVGLPLWALAHIRIDGDGLPGEAAMQGYWLIFEIFLRPILILFGFLAAILFFSAQVQILNEIWDIATDNVAAFNPDQLAAQQAQLSAIDYLKSIEHSRGIVDKFFYTVMFAIVTYMIGTASFKMIDQVPNFITRWAGAQVETFNDNRGDVAEGLSRNMYLGSGMLGRGLQGVGGGMQKTAGGLAGAAGSGGS